MKNIGTKIVSVAISAVMIASLAVTGFAADKAIVVMAPGPVVKPPPAPPILIQPKPVASEDLFETINKNLDKNIDAFRKDYDDNKLYMADLTSVLMIVTAFYEAEQKGYFDGKLFDEDLLRIKNALRGVTAYKDGMRFYDKRLDAKQLPYNGHDTQDKAQAIIKKINQLLDEVVE